MQIPTEPIGSIPRTTADRGIPPFSDDSPRRARPPSPGSGHGCRDGDGISDHGARLVSPDEDERRSVAPQNAQGVLRERTRIEDELRSAKHDLETAAEEIRKRSEWLRITLASIGDAVITTDEEGRVTSLNPVAETLTGWPQAEAPGLPLEQVFGSSTKRAAQPVTNPALRSLQDGPHRGPGEPHAADREGRHASAPIDDSAAPIRDENGTILGAVLIFRDVTEQRRADYASRHLAAVVAHSRRRDHHEGPQRHRHDLERGRSPDLRLHGRGDRGAFDHDAHSRRETVRGGRHPGAA